MNNALFKILPVLAASLCATGSSFAEEKLLLWPQYVGLNSWANKVPVEQSENFSGIAYLVAHSAKRNDPKPRQDNLSWISGDHINLIRVKPSPETINDRTAYEYLAGRDDNGKDIWSSNINEIKPIFEWNNDAGCVTMSYNAPLKKYLMCNTDGWPTTQSMNTYILESDHLTGPRKMVQFMKDFGPQAYFVNIPSKFISEDGKTAWLCYSANFTYTLIQRLLRASPKAATTPFPSTKYFFGNLEMDSVLIQGASENLPLSSYR